MTCIVKVSKSTDRFKGMVKELSLHLMGNNRELHQYHHREPQFWKITLGLTLASLYNFANLYMVQPLLPLYTREFGISPTTSSLALSLTTFSLIISLLIFGFLSDRIGRIGIIHWTLFLSVIPLFLIPITESYIWLLIGRLISGILIAGLPAVAVAYISEEIAPNSRGLAVSLYIASNALGGMGGRVLGGAFAEHLSWQQGFLTLGAIGLVISVLCFLVIPKSQFFQQNHRSYKQDILGMAIHLKKTKLLFAFIFGLLIQVGFSGVWVYIPFHVEKEPFSLSVQAISLLFLTYLFGVVGSPIAGRLADRFGLMRIMSMGLLVMTAGTLVTLGNHLFYVISGLSLICLGFFIMHSLTSTWVGNTATHHKSGATSLYLFSYYMGVTLGGTTLGVIWSNYGWLGVVVICAILPLISGMIFFRMMVSDTKEARTLTENYEG
ncbi:MFS transporter [Salinibacillus xinjiangensis]|nr:MFS transporter [Salinibacillus xinjiangensis]